MTIESTTTTNTSTTDNTNYIYGSGAATAIGSYLIPAGRNANLAQKLFAWTGAVCHKTGALSGHIRNMLRGHIHHNAGGNSFVRKKVIAVSALLAASPFMSPLALGLGVTALGLGASYLYSKETVVEKNTKETETIERVKEKRTRANERNGV